MIEGRIFEHVRQRYGLQASWAVWGDFGPRPKDGMDDLTIFEGTKLQRTLLDLHTRYVLVGLNISTERISRPLSNFHGKNGEVYKVRFSVSGTDLWGSYMTDILKDFPDAKSNRVEKYLESSEGQKLELMNVERFEDELRCVGAQDATLVAFGNITFQILQKYYHKRNPIIKLHHYGYPVRKERYRELVHAALGLKSGAPSPSGSCWE